MAQNEHLLNPDTKVNQFFGFTKLFQKIFKKFYYLGFSVFLNQRKSLLLVSVHKAYFQPKS